MDTREFIAEFAEKNIVKSLGKLRRHSRENKRSVGKVLICAGSFGMAGALIMSVRGALRSGAGLVTCYTDREIIPIVQAAEPQAMCIPCDESLDFNEYDSVAFGPGFFVRDGRKILVKLLSEYQGKLVIDAEGLNIIARENLFDLLRSSKADIVITPHEGEASRLLDRDCIGGSKIRIENRKTAVKKLAEKTGAAVLFKGSNTLVCKEFYRLTGRYLEYSFSNALGEEEVENLKELELFEPVNNILKELKTSYKTEKENIIEKIEGSCISANDIDSQDVLNIYLMYMNRTGNPALATGGSGDVLTGMVGAFLAKGMSGFEAAGTGAFIHGKAADIWAKEHGYIGMSFRDLTNLIPDVLNEYLDFN